MTFIKRNSWPAIQRYILKTGKEIHVHKEIHELHFKEILWKYGFWKLAQNAVIFEKGLSMVASSAHLGSVMKVWIILTRSPNFPYELVNCKEVAIAENSLREPWNFRRPFRCCIFLEVWIIFPRSVDFPDELVRR